MKNLVAWALAMILVIGLTAVAFAHGTHSPPSLKVKVISSKKVFVEAKYGTGAPANNSRIVIMDIKENKLLDGKTDRNGKFFFKPPVYDDLIILLITADGHRMEYLLEKDAIPKPKEKPESAKPYIPPFAVTPAPDPEKSDKGESPDEEGSTPVPEEKE